MQLFFQRSTHKCRWRGVLRYDVKGKAGVVLSCGQSSCPSLSLLFSFLFLPLAPYLPLTFSTFPLFLLLPFPSLSFLSPSFLPPSPSFLLFLFLPYFLFPSPSLSPSLRFLSLLFLLSVSFSPFLIFFFSSVMTPNPLFG